MAQVKTLVFRYVFIYYNRLRVYTANPGGTAGNLQARGSAPGCGWAVDLIIGQLHDFGGGSQPPPYSTFF